MLKFLVTFMVLGPALASTALAQAEHESAPGPAQAPVLLAQAAGHEEATPGAEGGSQAPEPEAGNDSGGETEATADPGPGSTESSGTAEPTAPPEGPPAAPSSAEMSQAMVEAHARVRAAVGLPPLSWSTALAAHAQQWTDHLKVSGCSLEHRTGSDSQGFGENLWATSGQGSAADAVGSWESEKSDFDPATNTCAAGKACGHYTQIVWRATTEVGCAASVCDNGNQIWACNYNPAGNIVGDKPF